jgi:hypothetical protein
MRERRNWRLHVKTRLATFGFVFRRELCDSPFQSSARRTERRAKRVPAGGAAVELLMLGIFVRARLCPGVAGPRDFIVANTCRRSFLCRCVDPVGPSRRCSPTSSCLRATAAPHATSDCAAGVITPSVPSSLRHCVVLPRALVAHRMRPLAAPPESSRTCHPSERRMDHVLFFPHPTPLFRCS